MVRFRARSARTPQELQLALMRHASFNELDGNRVVRDLERRPELWAAALMSRDDLVSLRDLPDGEWNVDTLYVLSSGEDDAALEQLARAWNADEVSWLGEEDAARLLGESPPEHRVLVVWWD
jgi:hypothetical protein